MISVQEATRRITLSARIVASEPVALADADARVLSSDIVARSEQPPGDISSMDGYAVRAADVAEVGTTLRVVGESAAGHPFSGRLGRGESVRIFTGALMPEGADTVLVQEDAVVHGAEVQFRDPATRLRHVRQAGFDFKPGDVLLPKGHRLTPRDLALLAAADYSNVGVRKRPRVMFAATGDELSLPGEPRKSGGIVASSGYGLSALIRRWGGDPVDLGIVPDRVEAIEKIVSAATESDLFLTIGGASVGEHDLIQRALKSSGFTLDFWKIAMRPGKPLIFGRLGSTPFIGLPGNPVSTLVCALLFVRPAIAALLGTPREQEMLRATLAGELPANDARQDYLRAKLRSDKGGQMVEPLDRQDSSHLSAFARADCLIVRKPHALPVRTGDKVEIIMLD